MGNPNVTFAPGERLGNYELLVELAAGGAATVGIAIYRGAAGFERLVVIKRMHRALTKDPEFTAMLMDEARLASSVRHPNVVPVIDVLRVDDEVVLVMDYVDSVALSQLLKTAERAGRPVPLPIVSRIVLDALTGLHEAHEAVDIRRQPLGIVHRDVSPQNVIVGVDGVSRVIDFGIAKARSRIARTRAGIIKGKCGYMSPEQVDGQPVDRRCDVFAAGIVLWEAITGSRLFRGDDEFDEMRRVMTAPIPPPASLVACGPDVDALLAHALARRADERFQTALAFARALQHAIPPAPPAAVAALVESTCGAELDFRYTRLLALLGSELEKLSPRTPKTHPPPTMPSPVAAPPPSRQATMRLEQPPRVTPPKPALPLETLKSHDAVADDEPPVVLPKRSLAPLFVVVTLVSLLVGAAGAFFWINR